MDDYHDTKTWSRLELAHQIDQELVRIARSGSPDEARNARRELFVRHEDALGPDADAATRRALRRAFEDAIRAYRPDRGQAFAVFAEARLRGARRAAARTEPTTPATPGSRFLQLRVAAADLEHETGRTPRLHELTRRSGLARSQVIDAWANRSADRVRTAQLAAALATDELDARTLTRRLDEVDERARRVLYRLEIDGRTRKQVAHELGLSTFDVAGIEREALERLAV